jgi:Uma2 family endonuclease
MSPLADFIKRLGGIPLDRVRLRPAPGTATEEDVLLVEAHEDWLCELVEGTLVVKGMGFSESVLAACLIQVIGGHVRSRNLGLVAGPNGPFRLMPGLVRIPDVSFTSWDRFPGRRLPAQPIPDLAPNLAVEVLSASNTPGEMARKRRDYFAAGVELVWEADPDDRTVTVYTAPDQFTVLGVAGTLDGGLVLPGFTLPVAEWFARPDRHG